MLLRSITKHVKDQNWFAVFIDFLIVVFGVYIGVWIGLLRQKIDISSESTISDHYHAER